MQIHYPQLPTCICFALLIAFYTYLSLSLSGQCLSRPRQFNRVLNCLNRVEGVQARSKCALASFVNRCTLPLSLIFSSSFVSTDDQSIDWLIVVLSSSRMKRQTNFKFVGWSIKDESLAYARSMIAVKAQQHIYILYCFLLLSIRLAFVSNRKNNQHTHTSRTRQWSWQSIEKINACRCTFLVWSNLSVGAENSERSRKIDRLRDWQVKRGSLTTEREKLTKLNLWRRWL